MVIDKLENASLYAPSGSLLAKAFEFLNRKDLATMENGRHAIDGENVFALVQSYDTTPKEKGKFEAHRRYIDVQFVVSGEECMGYANVNDIEVAESYNEKDDYLLGRPPEGTRPDFVRVRPGMFAIFRPQDAHIPCAAVDKPSPVKKVVVKVKVE
jgi:YhcH/YjgK/YiaL family protein